jgi:hypothetical protein
MRSRKPFWLVILLVLWLPLQGYAAPMMPFCQHGHECASGMDGADGLPCCPDHQSHHDKTPASGCDNCAFCHLCATPAPLAAELLVVATPPPARGDLPMFTESFRSHIPEYLWRPPRS